VAGATSQSLSFGNFGVERNLLSLTDEPPPPPLREDFAGEGIEEDEPARREFEPDKEEERDS
jgi:hypothetical protein